MNVIQAIAFFCLAGSAFAHFDLYHNLEVSLTDPDKITIFATIHEMDLGEDDFLTFLAKTYKVELGGQAITLAAKLDESEEELPEDCTLVSLEIPNPGQQLLVSLAEKSEKRLMLVVTRSGEFPDVRDLEPGATSPIELPEPPPPPAPIVVAETPPESSSASKTPLFLGGLAALAILLIAVTALKKSARLAK